MENEMRCLVDLGEDCSKCERLDPRIARTNSSAETHPLREGLRCPNPEIMRWPRRERRRHW